MQLSLTQVSKLYQGKIWGLQDFSLDSDAKRIGILGPFGSGKSTLVHIITSVTKPTKGSIYFNGKDITDSPEELSSIIGYLPQYFGVYSTLTTMEYLDYLTTLKGTKRNHNKKSIETLLDVTGLSEVKNTMLGTLSPAMRERLGIAQMFHDEPLLLVVDEFSEELLPEERSQLLRMLSEQSTGKMLIMASEYASDFEGLVDEIYILLGGRTVARTTPAEMLNTVNGKVWEEKIPNANLSAVRRKFLTTKFEHTREGIIVRLISEQEPGEQAKRVSPTLDDAYQYFLYQVKGTIQ